MIGALIRWIARPEIEAAVLEERRAVVRKLRDSAAVLPDGTSLPQRRAVCRAFAQATMEINAGAHRAPTNRKAGAT